MSYMERGEVRRALADWAIARSESDQARDLLVREAIAAGLNRREIHFITGLARTTINDILKEDAVLGQWVLGRQPPDVDYLRARDSALEAAVGLDPKHDRYSAPGGIMLWFRRKPAFPLRYFVHLQIARSEPDTPGWTVFNFDRHDRVTLSGNRKLPISKMLLQGHDVWASQEELEELAGQLKAAAPEEQIQQGENRE